MGIAGLTSQDLISNINSLVSNEDDIVILMIGTNDRISGRNSNLQEYYEKMKKLYTLIKNKGKDIILMSNIPASIANETVDMNFHMEDVDHVVMKVANDYKTEYISIYKEFLDYCNLKGVEIDTMLKDGLHPNDGGYDVMFNIICHKLGLGIKRPNATW